MTAIDTRIAVAGCPTQPASEEVELRWLSAAELDDRSVGDVVGLLNEVVSVERNMGYNEPIDGEAGQASIRRSLEGDLAAGGSVMVARCGDRIVGTVAMIPSGLPARRHVAEIKRCVIAIDHRGTLMLDAWDVLRDRARATGIEVLVIDVRTDYPRTLHLWKKLGFTEFGRLPRYARMDGVDIEGVFLYFDLVAENELH